MEYSGEALNQSNMVGFYCKEFRIMPRTHRMYRSTGLVLVLAIAGYAGFGTPVASGQSRSDSPPLLQGPKVNVRKVPGVQERYIPGNVGGIRNAEMPIPLPVFFEMLGKLGHEPGSAALGLDEDQRGQIMALASEMRDDLQRYIEGHAQEVKRLIAQLPSDKQKRETQTFSSLERISKMLDRVVRSKALSGNQRRNQRVQREQPHKPEAEGRKGNHRFRLHLGEFDREGRARGQGNEAPPMGTDQMAPMYKMQEHNPQTIPDDGEMAGGDAISQLDALWQAAPSAGQLQTRVWMLLRQDQQDALSRTLEVYQQQRQAEREKARLERDITRRKGAQKDAADLNRTNRSFDKNKTGARGGNEQFDQARRSIDIDPALIDRALGELEGGKISERLWKRLPPKVHTWLLRIPENRRGEALRSFLERYRHKTLPATNPPHSG